MSITTSSEALDVFLSWVMADGVMSVEWSASSEWVLITGGCDGAIRFWDIRRAGCFRVLDQSHNQLGRRPSLLTRSTASKVTFCHYVLFRIIFEILMARIILLFLDKIETDHCLLLFVIVSCSWSKFDIDPLKPNYLIHLGVYHIGFKRVPFLTGQCSEK